MTDPTRRAVPPYPEMADRDEEYEYRILVLPRGISRSEAWRLLTDHAEYGRWELARVQVKLGGVRRVWLRRRIMRVVRTA